VSGATLSMAWGGGRIPFDVNVALAPAALRSIASLAEMFDADMFGSHAEYWAKRAEHYAQVWEEKTIGMFKVVLPARTVRKRLRTFAQTSGYYNGPAHDELVDSDMAYHAMALEGHNGLDVVPVMDTDASVRISSSTAPSRKDSLTSSTTPLSLSCAPTLQA
jgi:hypothetical protein